MERVLKLAKHFMVPAMVCVNKFDLNPEQTRAIEKLAQKQNLTFLEEIPFDPIFTESMVQGKTVLEYRRDSGVNPVIQRIWDKIMTSLDIGNIKKATIQKELLQ
jgi:MinD superfamily P-loop ATPase